MPPKSRKKRRKRNTSSNRNTPIGRFAAIAFVVTASVLLTATFLPLAMNALVDIGGGGTNSTTTTTTTGGGTIETLQWDFFTNDLYAGGSADCAVAVYDPVSNQLLESGEAGSDGKWTTTNYYTSDDVYDIKYGNGTFVEQWVLGVKVPRFQGTVLSGATHKTTQFVVDQGTFTLKAEYGVSRTNIADAGNYNSTTSGTDVTFYFTITNTEVDSGFKSSTNPILDMDCNAILEIYATGTEYQDVGWTNNYEEKNNGAQQSWYIPIGDLQITYDKDAAGNDVHDGTVTFSATMDLAAVTGSGVDIYYKLILGTSIAYLDGHTGLPSSTYAYTYSTSQYFNILV